MPRIANPVRPVRLWFAPPDHCKKPGPSRILAFLLVHAPRRQVCKKKPVSQKRGAKLAIILACSAVHNAAGICGNSSVGRAIPCQGIGRRFEPVFPLQITKREALQLPFFHGAGAVPAGGECDRIFVFSGFRPGLVRRLTWQRVMQARVVKSVDTRDLKEI